MIKHIISHIFRSIFKDAQSVDSSNTPVSSNRPKNRNSTTYNLLPTKKVLTHASPRLRRIKLASPAFTIVELLVVIVVIGVLAAITIVSYTGISQKATVASFQSDLNNASRLLKMDQVINGGYPASTSQLNNNKGLVASNGATFASYEYNNTVIPQTFCLTLKKDTTYYRITNDSIPTSGACMGLYATGGTITDSGGYRINTFTTSGTFTVNSGISNVEVLVVAGGGGGAAMTGGGGGAGGVLYNATHAVSTQSYVVTVGAGGAGQIGASNPGYGSDGQNSVFDNLTAIGGGGGATNAGNGRLGGSGGGSGHSNTTGGAGTAGQGYSGSGGATGVPNYGAGGGGGAGAVGGVPTNTNGGNGGIGVSYSISGSSAYYAGGGGGGTYLGGTPGNGGLGGGGNSPAGNATANTGGGGGGQINNGSNAGAGGSGIVIVRYLLP